MREWADNLQSLKWYLLVLSSIKRCRHYHVIYFTNERYHKHFSWYLLCSTEFREVPVEYEMCSTNWKCSTKLPSRIRPLLFCSPYVTHLSELSETKVLGRFCGRPSERSNPAFRVCINWCLIVFTGKIRCCFFRICAFQYFILFHVITASYLLGREQKYTAGSVSSEGDSIFYSGISAVKSVSHVLKLYGDLSVFIIIDPTMWQLHCKLRNIPSVWPMLVLMPHEKSNFNMK